jgi:hypothetical protein
MSWFNPIKGAYPSLQQISKSLPVHADATGIVRGSLVYESSGTWKLAGAAQATNPAAYIHFALKSQLDLTAGMAGTIGQGSGMHWNGTTMVRGTAVVPALSVGMPMEVETDMFDTGETYASEDLLTVGANGKLTLHTAGDNIVGQVTKGVSTRWVNDAVAVTGWRTGANVSVLVFRTLWVPTYTAA